MSKSAYTIGPGTGVLLARKGQHALLDSIMVTQAGSPGSAVTVYEGENPLTGAVAAAVDASALGSQQFDNTRLPAGMYATFSGSAGSAVISYEGNPGSTGQLIVSGNEMTDALRTLGLQGDGETTPAGVGIWDVATNKVTNGGLESNTTGWSSTGASASISRVTSSAKFGAASLQIAVSPAADQNGAICDAMTSTPGSTYTASFWVWGTGTVKLRLTEQNSGAFVRDNDSGAVVLSATPQRVRLTVTTQATTNQLRVQAITSGSQAITFNIDGVQTELGPIATPYVETNGSVATRSAARVQAPAALIGSTQSWVAFRVRMANISTTSRTCELFCWRDDGTHRIEFVWEGSTGQWRLMRVNPTNGTTLSVSDSFAAGATKTLIGYWTGTALAISIDGGAFTTAADSFIPTIAETLFDIGAQASGVGGTPGSQLSGDVLWFACGTGTLADADAAAINSFGNTRHLPTDFTGGCTATWLADSNTFYLP